MTLRDDLQEASVAVDFLEDVSTGKRLADAPKAKKAAKELRTQLARLEALLNERDE